MSLWKSTIESQTKEQIYHNGKRLIRSYLLNGEVEISYFQTEYSNRLDEIYISFGVFSGVAYADRDKALGAFLRMTVEIEREYNANHGEPSNAFIYRFMRKYEVERTTECFLNFNQLFFPVKLINSDPLAFSF